MLSLLGGALGALLAQITIDVTLPLVPEAPLPRIDGLVIDVRVMAFGLGLSLVSTLVVGLGPALRVGDAAFSEGRALHACGSRTTGDRQDERMRTLLVAAHIALPLSAPRTGREDSNLRPLGPEPILFRENHA
ncbi:MAG: hypothetical protein IT183_12775 [Acidobacteria bacterium]|nr:hypothetical protein [Acidobacteriota bacterium]